MRALFTIFIAILGIKFISILFESWSAQPSKLHAPSPGLNEFLASVDDDNTKDKDAADGNVDGDMGELECACDTTTAFFGDISSDDKDEPDDELDDNLNFDDDITVDDSDGEEPDSPLTITDNAGPQGFSLEPAGPAVIKETLSVEPKTELPFRKDAPVSIVQPKLAQNFKYQGNIIIATDKDFDKILEEYDYVFVDFFAPWCPHCQALSPEFTKAADKLAQLGSKIVLCKVDVTTNRKLRTRYKTKVLPTLKLFRRGGQPLSYISRRSAGPMVNWIRKKVDNKKIKDQKKF